MTINEATMWGVRVLKETITVNAMGVNVQLKLEWADGMIGAMPVFKKKKDALAYSENEDLIFELVKEKEKHE